MIRYSEIRRATARATAIAGVMSLVTGSGAVYAQQQKSDAASDAAPALQEVVVTGTMIKRTNAETAEAITILSADSLKDQGITSVEQALSSLPPTTRRSTSPRA